MTPSDNSLEERIRARAHQIWEEEGRPDGRDRDHWYRASREIMAEGDGAGSPPEGRDFGDSAGYGSDGSVIGRHEVGDAQAEEEQA